MGSNWSSEVTYSCSNDCRQEGCPSHKMKLERHRGSDVVRLWIDGNPAYYFDDNQFSTMLKLAAPPEKEPGPRCPKCGKATLKLMSSGIFGAYVECHNDEAGCDFDLATNQVADFAQFFPPSPQERWVPDAETLAKKMYEHVMIKVWGYSPEVTASPSSWDLQSNLFTRMAEAALAALPAPPAQPSPQASDKQKA